MLNLTQNESRKVRISVVMSVFNGEKYLREAVDSILAQTLTDFEFIIVDDGSTDRSLEIIQSYARQDARILVVRQAENLGLAKSLNRGIALARGDLIARMDADDISLPDRFETQVQFLYENPDVDLVGSWVEFIDQNGKTTGEVSKYPGSAMGLRWGLFFENHLWHPTVMARRSFFDCADVYDEAFDTTQDYELWARSNLHSRYRNIQKVLLKYRMHDSSISKLRNTSQMANLYCISQRTISFYLGKEIPVETVRFIINPDRVHSTRTYFSALSILHQLSKKLREENRLQPIEFVEVNLNLAYRYSKIACQNFHILFSWMLRLYAVCIVLYTLVFKYMITWPLLARLLARSTVTTMRNSPADDQEGTFDALP